MHYQSSQSTGDGRVTITVTFKLGTDLDMAQVLVQDRSLAEPALPRGGPPARRVVRKIGQSDDGGQPFSADVRFDLRYVSTMRDANPRRGLPRVARDRRCQIFGADDYSMRLWIDPGRDRRSSLTAGDVIKRVREQERAGGRRRGRRQPLRRRAPQSPSKPQGRLTTRRSSARSSSRPSDDRRVTLCATSHASSSAPPTTA